jgi:hypothetical protein
LKPLVDDSAHFLKQDAGTLRHADYYAAKRWDFAAVVCGGQALSIGNAAA